MDTKNKIKSFLHAFFVIKKEVFYQYNKPIIHDFKKNQDYTVLQKIDRLVLRKSII